MSRWLERVRHFLDQELWRGTQWWVRSLQFLFMVVEGFVRNQLLLRAHSLTYITLLSLIPLLALAVSIVSSLGIKEDLVGLAVQQLATISPQAAEWLQGRIGAIKFGSLGTVGAAVLVVTTLMAIGNVERSFNHIWGVPRQRGWVRRIPDYLAVVVIVPMVLGVAISVGTSLRSQAVVAWLLQWPLFDAAYRSGLQQVPTVMYMLGFAFIYWFLPNTNVRAVAALLGGVVAGVLFSLVQAAYVGLNVGVAKYDVIFGGIAFLPFLIVFIYFGWAIVLLGAEVSFAYQNLARYRREVKGEVPSPATREAIGLGIALEIARRFDAGGESWTDDSLADALDVRVRTVREVLAGLEAAGIVAQRADGERQGLYLLARPAERISVGEVLDALRGRRAALVPEVDRVFAEIEKRARDVAEGETLADLLRR